MEIRERKKISQNRTSLSRKNEKKFLPATIFFLNAYLALHCYTLINVWLSNIYILIIDILTGFFSIDFARSHVDSFFVFSLFLLFYRIYSIENSQFNYSIVLHFIRSDRSFRWQDCLINKVHFYVCCELRNKRDTRKCQHRVCWISSRFDVVVVAAALVISFDWQLGF